MVDVQISWDLLYIIVVKVYIVSSVGICIYFFL